MKLEVNERDCSLPGLLDAVKSASMPHTWAEASQISRN
jgi:hypothetical protein